jgi:hypothetical protein
LPSLRLRIFTLGRWPFARIFDQTLLNSIETIAKLVCTIESTKCKSTLVTQPIAQRWAKRSYRPLGADYSIIADRRF